MSTLAGSMGHDHPPPRAAGPLALSGSGSRKYAELASYGPRQSANRDKPKRAATRSALGGRGRASGLSDGPNAVLVEPE